MIKEVQRQCFRRGRSKGMKHFATEVAEATQCNHKGQDPVRRATSTIKKAFGTFKSGIGTARELVATKEGGRVRAWWLRLCATD